MDKINQEIVDAKLRLHEIEKEKTKLGEEYKLLQDKIHLYFDSPSIDTTEAEKFVISYFWQNAYKEYSDGGYIINDDFISDVRFRYECELLEKVIKENCKTTKRAIDLGCGNGRYTKFFATLFDEVVGADLSAPRIEQNIEENKLENVSFTCKNALEVDLGQFDMVFASDMFTYTAKNDIEKMFEKLLNLVNKNGKLLTRESTHDIGFDDYASYKYIAYYRNFQFYTKDIFEKNFEKLYKNYGYSMYYLHKYFNVNPSMKEKAKQNPSLLKDIVKNYVNPNERTSYFYVFGK